MPSTERAARSSRCTPTCVGVGTALLGEVKRVRAGWMHAAVGVTTNDNIDALRFYPRRGFRLAALRRGAVDDSRARLTPEISEIADHRILLRDELELELELQPDSRPGERSRRSARLHGSCRVNGAA